jgi:hypothetical protein
MCHAGLGAGLITPIRLRAVRVRLISHLEGDFASKPFCEPVEMHSTL